MKLLLYPIFGGSGVGLGKERHYFLPETQLCIHNRAFPWQADRSFIKLPTRDTPLVIGTIIPTIYEGTVYMRKIADDNWHYHEYEVMHDGFGNKPAWVYAKDLKQVSFLDYSKHTANTVFEEKFTIEYIRMLPDDMKILVLLFA